MGIGRLHTSTNPRLLASGVRETLAEEFPSHIAASRDIVAGNRRGVARGLGLEASR